jgi:hypothetical protein
MVKSLYSQFYFSLFTVPIHRAMLYFWLRRERSDRGKGGSYNGVCAALLLRLRERGLALVLFDKSRVMSHPRLFSHDVCEGEIPFDTILVKWKRKNRRFFLFHFTNIVSKGISPFS